MLRNDDRKESLAQRVRLALQRAEAVLKYVKVLRREGDEAALGQASGEGFVVRISFLADRVLRPAFQTVLADDHRPFFARLQIGGQKQNAVSDHVGENV